MSIFLGEDPQTLLLSNKLMCTQALPCSFILNKNHLYRVTPIGDHIQDLDIRENSIRELDHSATPDQFIREFGNSTWQWVDGSIKYVEGAPKPCVDGMKFETHGRFFNVGHPSPFINPHIPVQYILQVLSNPKLTADQVIKGLRSRFKCEIPKLQRNFINSNLEIGDDPEVRHIEDLVTVITLNSPT